MNKKTITIMLADKIQSILVKAPPIFPSTNICLHPKIHKWTVWIEVPSDSEIQEAIINHCIVELGWQQVSLYCGFVDRDHVWTSAAVFCALDVGPCFFRMLCYSTGWFWDVFSVSCGVCMLGAFCVNGGLFYSCLSV